MKKWICNVCGYTHNGQRPPEKCPECKAPSTLFHWKERRGCNRYTFLVLIFIMGATVILMNVLACRSTLTVDNSTITKFDMKRYLGKWYEIARFDHRFERGLEECTANYTLQKDGTIIVTNKGMKEGKWKTSEGKAKLTDTPGVLRVSFFGPFYSDYRVLMLAPDYSYALIGGSSDNYLWILSRTPQLKKDTKDKLIKEARKRGYATDNLIWVKQTQMSAWH